jgi:hypothetical protein
MASQITRREFVKQLLLTPAAMAWTAQALAGDPEASPLQAVVPFGLPEEPPHRHGYPLREALKSTPGDLVALWSGGLWDWMDPALAVEAMAALVRGGHDVHLVFLGGTRPGGDTMRAAAGEARTAVARLGL